MFYTYILRLENGQYYTGYTTDLKARLEKHENHSVPTTSRNRPKELIFYAAFTTEKKVLDFEKYLKSSSGFAFRNKRLIDI
jgi:putative endonuclease